MLRSPGTACMSEYRQFFSATGGIANNESLNYEAFW